MLDVLAIASQEYVVQRRRWAATRGKTDRWIPPSKDKRDLTDNDKAFLHMGKRLLVRGYNPIQAVRHIFQQAALRSWPRVEPKDVFRVQEVPSKLQLEAKELASAAIRSTISLASRILLESEFMLEDDSPLAPELLGEDLDPVLGLKICESTGFPADKQLVRAAIRAYLFCPAAYTEICPDDIPNVVRGVTVYEDLIHGGG